MELGPPYLNSECFVDYLISPAHTLIDSGSLIMSIINEPLLASLMHWPLALLHTVAACFCVLVSRSLTGTETVCFSSVSELSSWPLGLIPLGQHPHLRGASSDGSQRGCSSHSGRWETGKEPPVFFFYCVERDFCGMVWSVFLMGLPLRGSSVETCSKAVLRCASPTRCF